MSGKSDLERAALVAENVLEWCQPIGMDQHAKWYQDAGKEIAEAIRSRLSETASICEAAQGSED